MRPAGQQGFSLLEMLASLAIIAGALLVSFDFIDESIRVFGEADQAAKDQITLTGEMALRRDLQAAKIFPPENTSSSGALDLVLNDGARVSWFRRGSTLYRVHQPANGGPDDSRPIIRNLNRWQWEILGPSLVEVRFQRRVPRPLSGLPKPGPPDRMKLRKDTRIVVSPRGSEGIGSW